MGGSPADPPDVDHRGFDQARERKERVASLSRVVQMIVAKVVVIAVSVIYASLFNVMVAFSRSAAAAERTATDVAARNGVGEQKVVLHPPVKKNYGS